MTTTAPEPTAADAPIVVFATTVRASVIEPVMEAIRGAADKVGRRIPGATFEINTQRGDKPWDWCLAHRRWNCDLGREYEKYGRCYKRLATPVHIEVVAAGLPLVDGNWQVAGILTRDQTGVIIATTPRHLENADQLANRHRHLMGQCDHCGKTRARNTTILLRNVTNGEVRPVGRNCIGDYTGGTIRAELLPVLTALAERFEQSMGVVLTEESDAPLVDVVALAARYVAAEGRYISRQNAGPREQPTVVRVREALIYDGAIAGRPAVLVSDLTDADRAAAEEAIATVRDDTTDQSEFANNLRAVANADWIIITGRRNRVGIAVYIPVAARRLRERQAERAATEKAKAERLSAWISTVGQRIDITGTVRYTRELDGDWGTRTLIVIDTPDGAVKWWASGAWELTDNEPVKLRGTVKQHEEYKGEKFTILTRCKLEVVAPAA